MKKYLLRKEIFALIFCLVIGLLSFQNLRRNLPEIAWLLRPQSSASGTCFSTLEKQMKDNIWLKNNFIEIYSYTQKLLDKREVRDFDIVKDDEGFLHYASFYMERDPQLLDYALRVRRLQDYVAPKGTQVLFVVTPGKYRIPHAARRGLPINDASDEIEELLFYLNRLGVKTLNLGGSLPSEKISYDELFFRTDHHWTIPGAFRGTELLTEKMEAEFGTVFPDKAYYLNYSKFTPVTYPGIMMGSMSRRTGAVFGGVEDFTALWPHYTGYFRRESTDKTGETEIRTGSFVDVLMSVSILGVDNKLYTESTYSLYLDSLQTREIIENLNHPDWPSIFMIRDSYFSPVITFLAPMCGRIEAVSSTAKADVLNTEQLLRDYQYDYVIVEMYPFNINDDSFNFFRTEVPYD